MFVTPLALRNPLEGFRTNHKPPELVFTVDEYMMDAPVLLIFNVWEVVVPALTVTAKEDGLTDTCAFRLRPPKRRKEKSE